MHSTTFFIVAIVAIAAQAWLLILFFFEPGLRYKISAPPPGGPGSDEFLKTLEALTDSKVQPRTQIEVLTNGERFYEAELEAIGKAQRSVNLEAYIFQRGEVAGRFVDALAQRARAGVKVNLVLDAIGSAGTWKSFLKPLLAAGGHFAWYHPLGFRTLADFNNRTHRELLVVDGRVGFIGGAGIADHWLHARPKKPRWRDTMLRIEGSALAALQGVFAENWLESTGELLMGEDYFPFCSTESRAVSLIVNSTPSAGASTRAHVLFQASLAAAQKSICITTPYFLPDSSVRQELARAVRQRNVLVRILTPGKKSDHFQTRQSSRRHYGVLLQAGVQIFEYQPAMIHAKCMIIDDVWSVVGSTNFDSRSFRLNDEVNMAVQSGDVARRLARDFERDLECSERITLEQWNKRSALVRLSEVFGRLFERQE